MFPTVTALSNSKSSGQELLKSIDKFSHFVHQLAISLFRNELEKYQSNLSTRPHAIVANKIDVEGSEKNLHDFLIGLKQETSTSVPVIPVSGKMGHNISKLVAFFKVMYDEQKQKDN